MQKCPRKGTLLIPRAITSSTAQWPRAEGPQAPCLVALSRLRVENFFSVPFTHVPFHLVARMAPASMSGPGLRDESRDRAWF